jgi:hypothetical protein
MISSTIVKPPDRRENWKRPVAGRLCDTTARPFPVPGVLAGGCGGGVRQGDHRRGVGGRRRIRYVAVHCAGGIAQAGRHDGDAVGRDNGRLRVGAGGSVHSVIVGIDAGRCQDTGGASDRIAVCHVDVNAFHVDLVVHDSARGHQDAAMHDRSSRRHRALRGIHARQAGIAAQAGELRQCGRSQDAQDDDHDDQFDQGETALRLDFEILVHYILRIM